MHQNNIFSWLWSFNEVIKLETGSGKWTSLYLVFSPIRLKNWTQIEIWTGIFHFFYDIHLTNLENSFCDLVSQSMAQTVAKNSSTLFALSRFSLHARGIEEAGEKTAYKRERLWHGGVKHALRLLDEFSHDQIMSTNYICYSGTSRFGSRSHLLS